MITEYLGFWNPDTTSVPDIRGHVASIVNWEADRQAHFLSAFSATRVPELLAVGESRAASMELIDAGCGVGRLLSMVEHSGAHCVGLDISSRMISEARAACTSTILRIVPPHFDWPLESGRADIVLSWLVLQHLPTEALVGRYLSEVARCLRLGGVLRFQTLLSHPNPRPVTWHGWTYPTTEAFAKVLTSVGLALIESDEGLGHPQWLVGSARREK